MAASARWLLEKIVIRIAAVVVEVVRQFGFDIGEQRSVLLLDLIGLERLFGLALLFQRAQMVFQRQRSTPCPRTSTAQLP
jgi:hypothetical protein